MHRLSFVLQTAAILGCCLSFTHCSDPESPETNSSSVDADSTTTDAADTNETESPDIRDTDPGDSQRSTCGPETCAGCCRDGKCFRGLEDNRCGSGGVQCSECSGANQCIEGDCRSTGCGNGVLEEGEECDGSKFRQSDCSQLDYESGQLKCSDSCTYDTSECEGNLCKVEKDKPSAERYCNVCDNDKLLKCTFAECPRETRDVFDCGARNETCVDMTADGNPISPRCLSPGGDECDPENFDRKCASDGDAKIYCAADGRTEPRACASNESCEIVNGEPTCLDEGSESCDPETFGRPRCEDDKLISCSSNGQTQIMDCLPESECRKAYGDLNECVNTSLGECSQFNALKCHENRTYKCLDGEWVLRSICEENENCSERVGCFRSQ